MDGAHGRRAGATLGIALAALGALAGGCAGRGAVPDASSPTVAAGASSTPIDGYRLVVDGLVERPLSLGYDELRASPRVAERMLLVCPGVFETRHEWAGTPLAALLERAGVRPEARRVRFTDPGGYEQELDLEQARAAGVLVAWEVDGHALLPEEGAPVRIAARNQPGSVWVKQLARIEVR
jgi:DMSO/TMAO reductase YedYZ molybdopterin-dependent catalytic subunit